MARKTGDWHEYHIEWLKGEANAAEYLNAAFEDGDRDGLLLALRNIAEAQGGISIVAEKAHIPRESMYRMLSLRGNPALSNLLAILHGMGMELVVRPLSADHPRPQPA